MNLAYLKDLGERVAATYVVSLATLLIAGWSDQPFAPSFLGSVAWAAAPAALSVLKGALAKFVGDRDSASLLP